ncbi:MAG: tyrosine-type recombinase/integrase [Acidimicrobiales bacterium]
MTSMLARAGYRPNTIRLARATLRAAINAAVAEGVVARNVVERSVAPKVSKQKRPTLDLDQAQDLLGSLDGEPYGPLIELALWTGMRRGELLALRWKDVDLDVGQARVSATLTRLTGKGLVESDPKTEESANTVPLVGRAVAALLRQRQAQLEASNRREGWRATEHVFHGPKGGPLDPARATKEWNAIRDARELPHITFHDLRHTTGTLLRGAGVPLEVIGRILRHASIRTTADVYVDIRDALTRDGLEALENALAGAHEVVVSP